ncbi:peptidoglycan-binding domain-containing protein [Catellatospora chokoriensis]|uniref:peptidoglycan-binding domain-containing protein n=1 Tax=Catellatospora chokoriensis TaxID=310353 RepID=UPI0017847E04|nr:peptidoglycan-binding domain-containing protein [Catellatospora chokoriensis]
MTITASPAQAATPKCNGLGYVVGTWVQDWDIEHDMVGYAPVYNPGPNMTWKCTMAPGLTNHWGVRALQTSLNSCYLSVIKTPLKVDGSYGPKTKAAVDLAQKWHKITRDGIYGPQTAAAMYHRTWAIEGPPGAKNAPGHWGCARLGVIQSGV